MPSDPSPAGHGLPPEDEGPEFRFYLLGSLRICRAGAELPGPPHRTLPLLARLLLQPGPQRREHLTGLLFPDVPEQTGRRRLSDLLWLLRDALPDLKIESDASCAGVPRAARWLDVETFQAALASDDLADWQAALALHRGDLLEGSYAEALIEDRELLYLQFVRLAHRTCVALANQGRYDELLPLAERLSLLEPYDEAALRTLMIAYQAAGRRGAALTAYERFLARLAQELEAEPEPSTQALARSIRVATALAPAGGRGVDDSRAARSMASTGSPPSGNGTQDVLQAAHLAAARYDRAALDDCLQRLRAVEPATADELALLELDRDLIAEDFERAGTLLARLDGRDAPLRLRAARLRLGRYAPAEALEAAAEAILLAREMSDVATEGEALLASAEAHLQLGNSIAALRTADQALRIARRLDAVECTAHALTVSGRCQYDQGRFRRALSRFIKARDVAQAAGLRYHCALALTGIRQVQCTLNQLREAKEIIDEELCLWRDLGLTRREADALEALAQVYDMLGHPEDSQRALERAGQLSEHIGDPVRLAINRYHLASAMIYHDDANAGRAVEVAEEALAGFRAFRLPRREAATLGILGYSLWVSGRPAEALDILKSASEVCERVGELNRVPELLAYESLAHVALGAPDRALAASRLAVAAMAQGEISQEVVPEIYFAHAEALQANGNDHQARDYYERAAASLIEGASQLEDETARQAFFHRNPTTRRLMRALEERGILPASSGRMVQKQLPAVGGDNPVAVRWTVDAGPADQALLQSRGAIALRRARLARLQREARDQGAAPTIAQLAEALRVSERTVQRDLAVLRNNPVHA